MADEAKVPGKTADAVQESVNEIKDAVDETAPKVRGRFAALYSDRDVQSVVGKGKPILKAAGIIAGGLAVAPEATLFITGGVATQKAAKAVDRALSRHYAAKSVTDSE